MSDYTSIMFVLDKEKTETFEFIGLEPRFSMFVTRGY